MTGEPTHPAVWSIASRYPLVLATVGVGTIGLCVLWAGQPQAARWLLTLFCAGIALRESWTAIRQIAGGMWGLDVLAVTAIASTLLVGDHWASLIIVLMVTGGAALEDFAQVRARRALTALISQTPRTAHRLGPAGNTVDIQVEDVSVGDQLQVRPGETVPVDSTLLSGYAVLDEAALTGESLPVPRSHGDRLLSGAVNGGTVIEVQVTAVSADSEFQKIVALVEAASNSKAPFVRLADRFAIPFTVAAYAIAGIAWFASGDPARFAEVMVVATPCPLLIAAPVAFIAGMDRAARSGVIVRSGGALEKLARLRSAAFDKTGTLTRGAPEVDRVEALPPYDSDGLLEIVAAVETQSGHVLAAAIVDAARARGLHLPTPTDTTEIPGKGLTAVISSLRVTVGKSSFVLPPGNAGPSPLCAGETAVYAAVDGRPIGRIVLRDETRPEAADALRALRGLGVARIVMLTGDAEQTADHVAAEVGITEVHASLLPAEKVDMMRSVTPRPVLMVGDGVNDAPVLAAADVGVALGARGSTAASETADVVILVDDLSKVVEVIRIARHTVAVAIQSIWVGIGLSVLLMIVASLGLIPAIAGATLQELVDVVTILNGLRAARPSDPTLKGPRRHDQAPMLSNTW
jgi:heavy metal translocating P-type ATPase